MSHVCPACPKTFESRRAAEQHYRAVHRRVPCPACAKPFKSQSAADQHYRDVHSHDDDDQVSDDDDTDEDDAPYPPFPGAYGAWVLAHAFVGRKSFGVFECGPCSKTWLTAHAQVQYRQGCKECNTMLYPLLMWESWETTDGRGGGTAKPHHRSRCEACMAGSCRL